MIIAVLALYDLLTSILFVQVRYQYLCTVIDKLQYPIQMTLIHTVGMVDYAQSTCYMMSVYGLFSLNAGGLMILLLGVDRLLAIVMPFR